MVGSGVDLWVSAVKPSPGDYCQRLLAVSKALHAFVVVGVKIVQSCDSSCLANLILIAQVKAGFAVFVPGGGVRHSREGALSSWRHLTLEPLMPHKQQ